MRYVFCALKDTKMNLFVSVMQFQSKGEAIRACTDEVNKPVSSQGPVSTLQVHPEDVELYEVGEWNNESGELRGSEPVLIVKCSELLAKRC